MTLRLNYSSMRRFHAGSSRRITLIFDIFRIGVVISYRGGMLTQSIPPQTFAACVLFCVLLFHSCIFMSCIFMSCIFTSVIFMSCNFSCPAISCPAHWSVNFTSVIFTSSIFSQPQISSSRCMRFETTETWASFEERLSKQDQEHKVSSNMESVPQFLVELFRRR